MTFNSNLQTLHYCVCHPRSKQDRIPTSQYCYNHCRFVCDNCVYDELNCRHVNCIVAKYQATEQLKSIHEKNTCPVCSEILPANPFKVLRLCCKCVYHVSCLKELLLSQPSNHIQCLQCNIFMDSPHFNRKSNLGKSVSKFMHLINSDRMFSKKYYKTGTASTTTATGTVAALADATASSSVALDMDGREKQAEKVRSARTITNTNANANATAISSSIDKIEDIQTRHRNTRPSTAVTRKFERTAGRQPRKQFSSRLPVKSKIRFRVRQCLLYAIIALAILSQLAFFYLIFFTGNNSEDSRNKKAGSASKKPI